MSEFYVVKREDAHSNSCPYWKEGNTWTGQLMDAWRFDCPFEAEFERKRRQTDGQTWVSKVTIREEEMVLSASPKPVPRGHIIA